jgi:uncharacterized alkaline shock family protein YloU
MEGQASISADILARYAGDAAGEVEGVRGLAKRGVKIAGDDGSVRVVLHLDVAWGVAIPEVARGVQERVREYLSRMADVEPAAVDVVVDEIGPVV